MGYVIHRGRSRVNNDPIVVIMTGSDRPSSNAKTGPMLQTYILSPNVHPGVATRTGEDDAVCGDCSARHYLGGHCYVRPWQDVASVWKVYKAGGYPDITRAPRRLKMLVRGRFVRMGAYGDPAVVADATLWHRIAEEAAGWTGYTHQWEQPWCDPTLRGLLMASTESVEDTERARALGWRTFRARGPGEPLLRSEVQCPHAVTGLQCLACLHCDGNARGLSGSVSEVVHGFRSSRFRGIEVKAA